MGDRSNVVIETNNWVQNPETSQWEKAPADETTRVYLYSHWGGQIGALTAAVAGADSGRYNDGQYLARVVFQALLDGDESETGYGISPRIGDNEHPIIVMNADDTTVRIIDRNNNFENVLYGPVQMTAFVDAAKPLLTKGTYNQIEMLIEAAAK